ncbi:AMIN domain-containing protein [Pseudanabaena sp. FACHB-1998]|uniref:secretin N-terminal domain-containing protein n=1 Tax=Pseudanabaena sp. FACHB-1998 TaxID=2692858 RepID=UPI001680B526|nr:secretin N-terminal domain-containing protein [Pseudanabaena sp. FACHB-1998]MBD2178163.1 AMIN domain-containing protein [Pseudanabaena sp. FACHB-1998]
MNVKMNAKLNIKSSSSDTRLHGKSWACWFLIALSCPQALAIAPMQAQNSAQNLSQTQVSVNQTSSTDVVAVASRITDINTNVAGDRLNLTLNFASSDRPQVTYSRQGKSWVALLNGAQLQLGSGNASYTKANPAPGITAIEATQYAANKVQIRVTASDPEMLKDLIKRQDSGDSLVFSLEMQASATQTGSISAANISSPDVLKTQNPPDNKVLTAQNTTTPNASLGKALFEPKVTITAADGKTRVAQATAQNTAPPPVANPVTPQVQGRVPGVVPPFRQIKTPPVGDIATTTSKLRPDIIDLGTAERVPRITLRDAPAIEVLTLIGRVAGLSVVSAETPTAAGAAPAAAGAATGLKQPVSLAVENETAQDVFNNVLRISGLEANRIGQTVFVATKLPVTLKNLVTKSYRLNQITVGEASAYLIGLGASRVVNRQRPIPGVTTATLGTASQAIVNIPTEAVPTLETVAINADSGATPLLKGLQVIAEERSNSITLIGTPRQVEFAESQVARLDLRKRQVTVNVRVLEVNLNNGQTVSGGLLLNGGNPTITGTGNQNIGITLNSGQPINLPTNLIANINASISNGNAKVLTDPSLTVQEGETATVALTQDVSTGTTVSDRIENGVTTRTTTATKADAGLTLSLQIERIDDNGFINLSVSPIVSAPIGSVPVPGGTPLTLLSKRVLNSGRIRLRDAQTLILSGVIQDSDIDSITKVPLLGDIPIIGALFRRSVTQNNRSEVVIIITPRIIDDSQNANWGYTYQPNPEAQKIIDSNQRQTQ